MVNPKIVICPHCEKTFTVTTRRAAQRETAIFYILMNPGVSTKEVSEKVGVSLRQAQKYKKSANEIRDLIAKTHSILFFSPYSLRSEA